MSVVSKPMFYEGLKGISCAQVLHPWTESCYKSSIQHIFFGIRGSLKFYLIIYFFQLLLKGNKINRDDIKQHVLQLLQSTLFGGTFVAMFVNTNCFFRRVLGKFHYYIFGGLASALGAFSIFLENHRRRGVTIVSFLYLMLEVLIRCSVEFNYIKRSTRTETLMFMICSAALLYILRIVKYQKSYLWFFLPPSFAKSKNEGREHSCPHRGSCWNDIILNSAKYFGFGILFQWLRSIIPKLNEVLGQPSLLNPFNWRNLRLGIFTGLYVIIYKATSCFLCKYRKTDSPLHAIISGFLAGTAYLVRPDLTVALIAFCNLLMISERHFKDIGILPKWPFSEFAYILASGILFHSQMVFPKCIPKQFVNLMHSFSNGRSTEINKQLADFIQRNQELKKLVQI